MTNTTSANVVDASPQSFAKKLRTEDALSPTVRPQAAPIDHFAEHYTDPDVDNQRVFNMKALIYPQLLMEEFPLTQQGKETVMSARRAAADIVHDRDDRLIVIVGPCSIHDVQAARDYGMKLRTEAERLKNDLLVIMRVYFEKPRTTVGWKGLINDPFIDDTFQVNVGLRASRRLLRDLTHSGVPCGCEFLDTMTPQYISDLVSWAAIGARTTECQLHRELASGLSMPVGFKNSTSGDCSVAIDAVVSACHPHCFFSINKQGTAAIVHSKGNKDSHIILRGGKTGPNYDKDTVAGVRKGLCKTPALGQAIVIDCSHGNSNKDFKKQPDVLKSVREEQLESSDLDVAKGVCGVMIESHLFEGAQKVPHDAGVGALDDAGLDDVFPLSSDFQCRALKRLRYGVSITDGCVSWMSTVTMLEDLARSVRIRRENLKCGNTNSH